MHQRRKTHKTPSATHPHPGHFLIVYYLYEPAERARFNHLCARGAVCALLHSRGGLDEQVIDYSRHVCVCARARASVCVCVRLLQNVKPHTIKCNLQLSTAHIHTRKHVYVSIYI